MSLTKWVAVGNCLYNPQMYLYTFCIHNTMYMYAPAKIHVVCIIEYMYIFYIHGLLFFCCFLSLYTITKLLIKHILENCVTIKHSRVAIETSATPSSLWTTPLVFLLFNNYYLFVIHYMYIVLVRVFLNDPHVLYVYMYCAQCAA